MHFVMTPVGSSGDIHPIVCVTVPVVSRIPGHSSRALGVRQAVNAMLVALAAVGALRVLRRKDGTESQTAAGVALTGVVVGGVAFVEYSRTWAVSQARILYPLLAPLLVLVVGGARDTARHVRRFVSGVDVRWLAALLCLALAVAWMATFRYALLAFHYGF
jgi:lysylphosphatidylglycerol synthetase-like protein (DUF2156 family)